MFKVNNINSRTKCETYFTPCSSASIVNFDQVNAGWEQSNNKPLSKCSSSKKFLVNFSQQACMLTKEGSPEQIFLIALVQLQRSSFSEHVAMVELDKKDNSDIIMVM